MRFEVGSREVWLAAGQRAAIVEVAGELDVHTAPRLKERLLRLERSGTHSILVDLVQATFVDSIGLGVLIGALNRARAAGGSLVLASPHPRIRRILNLTRLSNAFTVAEDEAAGLRALAEETTVVPDAPAPAPPQPASPDVVELMIPGQPEHVSVARLVVAGIASGMGFSYDEVEDIKLAVGEACTGALGEGEARRSRPVGLRCHVDPEALMIDVVDPQPGEASWLDQADEEDSIGRLIIESLMDKVEMAPGGDTGVCMRMVKYRPRTV